MRAGIRGIGKKWAVNLVMSAAVWGMLWMGTAAAELSSTPRAETWVTNGVVTAIATTSTTTYIGGSFTYVGPKTGSFVTIDAGTGVLAQPYAMVDGQVQACVPDGSGGWYIGGSFNKVGTIPRICIAHILSNGKLDLAWNPSAYGPVYALALSGTTLYVGGSFGTISGQLRNNIAALDTVSGAATAWNPNADALVNTLAVSGSTVYAGGGFNNIGGQTRNYIAALDAATGLASAWNPNANTTVYTLVLSGSTVYAGGSFTNIGGQTRNRIAALDTGTGLASAWNPNAGDTVRAMAVSGSTVYAGGAFSSLGGQARNNLAALDAATGQLTAWNPNAGNSVLALAVSGSTVYAGGLFTIIGGQARNRIAALDATSGTVTAWNPNSGGSVYALAVSGSTVYVGGFFTNIGGQMRGRIAALDATSGTATAWTPHATSGTVQALAVSGTTVYAGGTFTNIGGQARARIAALNAAVNTNNATAWNPDASLTVNALAVSGTTVYAGGGFTTIGGQTRRYIAALDATSGLATTWNPNANWSVAALAVSGTNVYVGGAFNTIGGQTRNYLAALDTTSGTATAWNPNAGSTVNAVTATGTKVYIGGGFNTIGAFLQPRFAQFDTVTGPAAPTNPGATVDADWIMWTWQDNSAEETGYKIYDGAGEGPPTVLRNTTAANAISWYHYGLSPNSLYAFQVAATNAVADSAKTANFTAWTLAAVAAAPTVSNPGLTTLDVAIGADANPAGTLYAVQISPAVGANAWVQADGSLGAAPVYLSAAAWGTKTVSGLAPGTLYAFTVTARNWDGVNSAAGPAGSGTTLAIPAAPDTPGATAVSANTITWTWADNSSNETGFKVYADAGSGDPAAYQTTTAQNATAWQYAGLTPNTQYAFQVAATNTVGDSAKTATFTKYTLPNAPSVGNNIACDKSVSTPFVGGSTFTFTNPAGFGAGTHGANAYRVSKFKYVWDTNAAYAFSGAETDWNSASLPLIAPAAGAYYLHLQSFNAEDVVNNATLDYGPFVIDALEPIAAAGNTPNVNLASAAGQYDFTILYIDNTAVNVASLDNADIRVSGPNGFNALAAFIASAPGTNTDLETATYRITPPGGTWDAADEGAYAISLESNQVSDTAGNLAASGELGGFIVDVTAPTAAISLVTSAVTSANTIVYRVAFDEPVAPTFNAMDLTPTGALWGTPDVSGGPEYTVSIALTDTIADGSVQFSIGADITDAVGNPCAGATSPACAVWNWHGITTQPQPVQQYAGGTKVLSVVPDCGAGSAIEYRWKWNDGQSKTIHDGPETSTWEIAVTPAANGVYWCAMSYDGQPYESDHVTVNIANPLGSTDLSNERRYFGEHLTFEVQASGGFLPLSYVWKKNGGEISGEIGPAYAITDIDAGDAATYSVTITDDIGTSLTKTGSLETAPPLRILEGPQNASRAKQESHTFAVTTSGGFPPLTYVWRHNNQTIDDATERTYTIDSLDEEDEGTYAVEVYDDNGAATMSEPAQLTVDGTETVPVGGVTMLGLLMTVTALGAATALRKKK